MLIQQLDKKIDCLQEQEAAFTVIVGNMLEVASNSVFIMKDMNKKLDDLKPTILYQEIPHIQGYSIDPGMAQGGQLMTLPAPYVSSGSFYNGGYGVLNATCPGIIIATDGRIIGKDSWGVRDCQ